MQPLRPYYQLSGKWGLTQLSTGQPFFVDTESRDLTVWILLLGRWEMFVDDVLCALARPGGVFLDIGANLGYYTVKVGGIVGPTGKVYAFEPNPDLYDFVQENIAINAYQSFITPLNVAVGEAAGELTLAYERHRPGGGSMLLPGEIPPAGFRNPVVPVVALDDCLPDGVVDLIKIDIEGFEPLAFRGMKRLLARSPDAAIVSEVSYHHWARFGAPAEILREFANGRRLFRIQQDGALIEIHDAELENSFDHNFISYMLMLPATAERFAQIAHLVKTPGGEEGASATGDVADEEPEASPVAAESPDAVEPAAPSSPEAVPAVQSGAPASPQTRFRGLAKRLGFGRSDPSASGG